MIFESESIIPPGGAFALDSVNSIFVVAFALAALPSLWYMWASGRRGKEIGIAGLFALASGACVLASNMLIMLVFWELMVITSYLLVRAGRTRLAAEAGQRYFVYHVLAGVSMLVATLLQFSTTGTLGFSAPGVAAVPFFLLGIGIKVGAMPFHVWIPDSYSRSRPAVAVVLSGFTTKVGVYAVARLLPGVAGVSYLGASMALFGVIMALLRRDTREILGYHIVSQVGYMIAGVGLATAAGMDAGSLHVLNNIFYKTLLFMCAGAVIRAAGSDYLPDLGGLMRRMPVTFACTVVGAVSIAGLPPFNGFVSKYWLKMALEGHPAIVWALTIAGVGTGASFSKIIWYTFLRPAAGRRGYSKVREVEFAMLGPMLALASLCLLLGTAPGLVARWLPGGGPVPVTFTASALWSCSWPALSGAVALYFGRHALASIPEPPDFDRVYVNVARRLRLAGRKMAASTEGHIQGNLIAVLCVLSLAIWLYT